MTGSAVAIWVWFLIWILAAAAVVAVAVSLIIIARDTGRMVRLMRREDMAGSAGEGRRGQCE